MRPPCWLPRPVSWPAVIPPTQQLQEGDTGAQVKRLQQALIHFGFLTEKADGSFGPLTKTAVEQFQSANGLTPHRAQSKVYSCPTADRGQIVGARVVSWSWSASGAIV